VTEKEKLGNEIRKIRESIQSTEYSKDHISQQELADKNMGLTKHLIGTIERGDANPTLEKMVYLAHALNKKKITIFDIDIDVEKFLNEINN